MTRSKYLVFLILLYSQDLFACPFCDYGAMDTAAFILVFFGFMAMGAFCFFILFYKKGDLKNRNLARSVLDAEGIKKGDSNE